MSSVDYIALVGAASAATVAQQAHRAASRGGGFYDRDVYGMTATVHRRVCLLASVVTIGCIVVALVPLFPVTPFVTVEIIAAILYLASFARGASYEDDE